MLKKNIGKQALEVGALELVAGGWRFEASLRHPPNHLRALPVYLGVWPLPLDYFQSCLG